MLPLASWAFHVRDVGRHGSPWSSIPGEPANLDYSVAEFHERRSRENRMRRKRAILAAAGRTQATQATLYRREYVNTLRITRNPAAW